MAHIDPIEALAAARHEFGEHGGVNLSIEASTTFTVMEAHTLPELFQGRLGPDQGGCYLYGRHFNPTVYVLGRQLAAIEGSEAAYCTASGMGAIAATLMQLCDSGDHVVCSNTVYGGTFALLSEYLPAKANVRATFVNVRDHASIERSFTPRTMVLYVETMANPTLVVADIPALAKIAHDRGAVLVVDNTFCPLLVSPLRLGADIVVHSLTKFISGGSDIIAGAICGRMEFIQRLMHVLNGSLMLLGPTMDPKVAFNLSLRIPHLGLRMIEHGRRTQIFAERLRESKMPVTYPGLAEHPDHALLTRLRSAEYGYGGLMTLDLGTPQRAEKFMEFLQNHERFGFMAVSLGYFETLMSASGSSTSSELTDDAKKAAGISPGLVRMSIGYTGSVEQRWRQLHAALRHVGLI